TVFCPLIASNAIRAFISALKLRRFFVVIRSPLGAAILHLNDLSEFWGAPHASSDGRGLWSADPELGASLHDDLDDPPAGLRSNHFESLCSIARYSASSASAGSGAGRSFLRSSDPDRYRGNRAVARVRSTDLPLSRATTHKLARLLRVDRRGTV